MSELTPLREAVDALACRAHAPELAELERRATRRGRRRAALVVAVVAAVVAGSVLAVTAPGDDRRAAPPVEEPEPVVGTGPVWYDAKGLHRGDVVEQTPVDILVPEGTPGSDLMKGALALVRTGALYLDPATGDVWLHPWGGTPRVVGHDSFGGPGGDPDGDTAAWFEGGDLVVYDTVTRREIARSQQFHGISVCGLCGEHRPPGNWFLQVSADRVAWAASWQSNHTAYVYDVRTGEVAETSVVDVHDEVEVLDRPRRPRTEGDLVLRTADGTERRYPKLEPRARLSPSGRYLLAVEGTSTTHGGVIVDTGTGEQWRVPRPGYPWIAWSYGDTAMIDLEEQLLACGAAARTCEQVPAERPFLMPTT